MPLPGIAGEAARSPGQLAPFDHPVHQAIRDRFLAGGVAVSFHVRVYPLHGLASVVGIDRAAGWLAEVGGQWDERLAALARMFESA